MREQRAELLKVLARIRTNETPAFIKAMPKEALEEAVHLIEAAQEIDGPEIAAQAKKPSD